MMAELNAFNDASPMRSTPTIRHLRDQSELQSLRQDNPNFSGTLAKGLMILQCFVADPRPHANSELADKLGMPRPTVSRLCRTLQALGFLDHDERIDRFFIGPAAVTLSYPYFIATPLLAQIRPAMQALALQVQGAVSVGVNMDLDVVYIESTVHEQGTLKRPGIGAVRSVVETAMGRAWLARLDKRERAAFLARMRRERAGELHRCHNGMEESLRAYAQRGFAINLGDAGLGVNAVGVASRIQYGSRQLLFNCAVPGYHARANALVHQLGPRLVGLVQFAERLMSAR